MDVEQISIVAQKISFAFEDHFFDKKKRKIFDALFNRYLASVDPHGTMEPYDAVILLGRETPHELENMIREMKEQELITD